MGTGRNWTRKSIEELVDQYIQKHAPGPGPTPVTDDELLKPNCTSYGYISFASAPSGYSKGPEPVWQKGMHCMYIAHNTGGQLSHTSICTEVYNLGNIAYAVSSDFANTLYPQRAGIRRGAQPSLNQRPENITHHTLYIVGDDNHPILKCNVDAFIEWERSVLSPTFSQGVTDVDIDCYALNNVKLEALHDTLVTHSSDIAQIMGVSWSATPYMSLYGYIVSEDDNLDDEIRLKVLDNLYPPLQIARRVSDIQDYTL